ncbi:hypothetical protein CLIM01_10381 [Colletotrichum limetticola]|uniref:Uncharacterized protein n=1 Tax=Colletotrichum limetticola TaxID=1209924 RepID=A0ABQ9PLV9_9PEZI|nr:hypothetical protein CLIM01_10381 [Colletotrichum limetticola]
MAGENGDARRKGGEYSTNPNTQRTRTYLANQTPEQRALKSKVFSEYRAFRTTCIKRASMSDYIYERDRDAKVKMLSDALNKLVANRTARNIEYMGQSVKRFAERYHDKAFLRSVEEANASTAPAQKSTTGLANLGQEDSEEDTANNVGTAAADISEELAAISQLLDMQARASMETYNGLTDIMHGLGF